MDEQKKINEGEFVYYREGNFIIEIIIFTFDQKKRYGLTLKGLKINGGRLISL